MKQNEGHVEIHRTENGNKFRVRNEAENHEHLSSSVQEFDSHDAALGNVRAHIELFGGVGVPVWDYSHNEPNPEKYMYYRDGTRQRLNEDFYSRGNIGESNL